MPQKLKRYKDQKEDRRMSKQGFLKREYTVVLKIETPEGVPIPALRTYIRQALASWGGQFDPNEDPLFDGISMRTAQFKVGGLRRRRKLHA